MKIQRLSKYARCGILLILRAAVITKYSSVIDKLLLYAVSGGTIFILSEKMKEFQEVVRYLVLQKRLSFR